MIRPLIIAFVVAALLRPLAGAEPAYHVVGRYDLGAGGESGGLRVDADARRIYVAHDNRLEVIDADSGKKVGAIPLSGQARGLALVAESKRGFCSDDTGALSTIDLEKLQLIKTVKLSGQPLGAVEYDPASKHVFVVGTGDGSLSAIDPATGEKLSAVTLGGKLTQIVANGYGWLFAAIQDQNLIRVVETASLKPLGDFPTGAGRNPLSLAIEPITKRLFVGCANGKFVIIDSDIGFPFITLSAGTGVSGIVCDRSEQTPPKGDPKWKGRVLFVSEDGALSVVRMISPVKWVLNGSTTVTPGAHAIAFDAKTNRAFIPAVEGGTLKLLVVGP